jgi:hypothetical protein
MNAIEDPAALVDRLRDTVRSHATRPLAWRIEQLTRLRTLLAPQPVTVPAAGTTAPSATSPRPCWLTWTGTRR